MKLDQGFFKSNLTFKQATTIMGAALCEKNDKRGMPIVAHCVRVATSVIFPPDLPEWMQEEWKIAAVLHDVVEDSTWTNTALRDVGLSRGTANIVEALTNQRKDEHGYWQYILNMMQHGDHDVREAAIAIKKADLLDNVNPTRFDGLDSATSKRLLATYCVAYRMLTGCSEDEFLNLRDRLPKIIE